jgi:hypothetical protein
MQFMAPAGPDAAFLAERPLASRGVLLVLFALTEGALVLLAFTVSFVSGLLLVRVLVAYLLLDGLAASWDSLGALSRRGAWIWPAAEALVSIASGVLIMLIAGQRLVVLGCWAIVTGLLEARMVFSPRGPARPRVAAAAASVVVGLFILAGPFPDPPRQILAFAVYGLIAGGLRVRAASRASRIR